MNPSSTTAVVAIGSTPDAGVQASAQSRPFWRECAEQITGALVAAGILSICREIWPSRSYTDGMCLVVSVLAFWGWVYLTKKLGLVMGPPDPPDPINYAFIFASATGGAAWAVVYYLGVIRPTFALPFIIGVVAVPSFWIIMVLFGMAVRKARSRQLQASRRN
jgi:hypothetical protein